jgi:hypothetical protein
MGVGSAACRTEGARCVAMRMGSDEVRGKGEGGGGAVLA